MTKKDFFILIIKLYGLLLVIDTIFSALPNSVAFAIMFIDIEGILIIASAVIILVVLFILLVFKADKLVRLLKLEKGFDDDRIELGNFKSSDIIKIGTFIIGGILFIENIPSFLSHSYFAFKSEIQGIDYSPSAKYYWAVNGINLIIGYLLVANFDWVAKKLSINKNKED